MTLAATIRARALDVFNLGALCLAVTMRTLTDHGIVGDAFEGIARVTGTGPAILCFAAVMLYGLYGAMLFLWYAISTVVGLVQIIRLRIIGRLPLRTRRSAH